MVKWYPDVLMVHNRYNIPCTRATCCFVFFFDEEEFLEPEIVLYFMKTLFPFLFLTLRCFDILFRTVAIDFYTILPRRLDTIHNCAMLS